MLGAAGRRRRWRRRQIQQHPLEGQPGAEEEGGGEEELTHKSFQFYHPHNLARVRQLIDAR